MCINDIKNNGGIAGSIVNFSNIIKMKKYFLNAKPYG